MGRNSRPHAHPYSYAHSRPADFGRVLATELHGFPPVRSAEGRERTSGSAQPPGHAPDAPPLHWPAINPCRNGDFYLGIARGRLKPHATQVVARRPFRSRPRRLATRPQGRVAKTGRRRGRMATLTAVPCGSAPECETWMSVKLASAGTTVTRRVIGRLGHSICKPFGLPPDGDSRCNFTWRPADPRPAI